MHTISTERETIYTRVYIYAYREREKETERETLERESRERNYMTNGTLFTHWACILSGGGL